VPKSLLLICPSCQCHVRAVDTSCPFCGFEMSASVRAALALRSPGVRLGRAALYALSMGTLTLASACSSGNSESGDGGNTDAPDETCVCPPYGHPADAGHFDSATEAAPDVSDTDSSDVTIAPPYGHPPFDAGSDGGD
jgi:hypothetical protein